MSQPGEMPVDADLDDEHAETVDSSAESEQAAKQLALAQRAEELMTAGRGGANWFFWIAGLSLVNTAVMHSGGDTYFVIGLGATLFVDVVAKEVAMQEPELRVILTAVAVGFSVVCSLVACVFGWVARKAILWAFGLGMFFYLLDGLLLVLVQDWMSVAFHAFALFSMWGGLTAYRELKSLKEQLAAVPAPEAA